MVKKKQILEYISNPYNFRSWLMSQDPDRVFTVVKIGNCALTRYSQEVGIPQIKSLYEDSVEIKTFWGTTTYSTPEWMGKFVKNSIHKAQIKDPHGVYGLTFTAEDARSVMEQVIREIPEWGM